LGTVVPQPNDPPSGSRTELCLEVVFHELMDQRKGTQLRQCVDLPAAPAAVERELVRLVADVVLNKIRGSARSWPDPGQITIVSAHRPSSHRRVQGQFLVQHL